MKELSRREFFQFISAPFIFRGINLPAFQDTEPSPSFLYELNTKKDRMIIEDLDTLSDFNVTSGGALIIKNGIASTLQGKSTPDMPWYSANANDDDIVKRDFPQIVFRAVTGNASEQWSDYQVRAAFIPLKNIKSDSPEVNGTNGLDIFLYYHDQNRLYVAEITKDGRMMIKKKTVPDGKNENEYIYVTMKEETVFPGEYRINNNLITPFVDSYIVLTGDIQTVDKAKVEMKFNVEIYNSKEDKIPVFSHSISGTDDGSLLDDESRLPAGEPFINGRAGIRTDSVETQMEFAVYKK